MEDKKRCIITNLPLIDGKKYGKCHSRIIHNLYKSCDQDINKTKDELKKLYYVEEYDSFYNSWSGCSRGLIKAGYINVDKKFIYEKYFKHRSICCLDGCNENVSFELVCQNSCCILHYNQNRFNPNRSEANFICLEDGNRFTNLRQLSRHIKSIGIKPEDYYNKHHRKNDDEGKCKWCLKPVKFKNVEVGYTNFCYNTDCNVNWYNKYENRAVNCANKISEAHSMGDTLPSQEKYWLKRGYTEDAAKLKVTERQSTNSIESIIKRNGCSHEDAVEIRANITNKWLKSFPKTNFSKVSQELFWLVYEKVKNDYNNIYFASLKNGKLSNDNKNHEFRVKTVRSSRKLDFYIKDINKCIEFDGTYWHNRTNSGDDGLRDDEIFSSLGCEILHVKEQDYYDNKDGVVEQCLKFLNNTNGC